jgi:hypothetical protein
LGYINSNIFLNYPNSYFDLNTLTPQQFKLAKLILFILCIPLFFSYNMLMGQGNTVSISLPNNLSATGSCIEIGDANLNSYSFQANVIIVNPQPLPGNPMTTTTYSVAKYDWKAQNLSLNSTVQIASGQLNTNANNMVYTETSTANTSDFNITLYNDQLLSPIYIIVDVELLETKKKETTDANGNITTSYSYANVIISKTLSQCVYILNPPSISLASSNNGTAVIENGVLKVQECCFIPITLYANQVTGAIADNYNWTIPSNWVAVGSLNNTSSITVIPDNNGIGSITCNATRSAASTTYSQNTSINILRTTPVIVPLSIPNQLCPGKYSASIAAICGANGYKWTLPNDFVLIGSNDNNLVEFDVPNNANGGELTIVIEMNCGFSITQSWQIQTVNDITLLDPIFKTGLEISNLINYGQQNDGMYYCDRFHYTRFSAASSLSLPTYYTSYQLHTNNDYINTIDWSIDDGGTGLVVFNVNGLQSKTVNVTQGVDLLNSPNVFLNGYGVPMYVNIRAITTDCIGRKSNMVSQRIFLDNDYWWTATGSNAYPFYNDCAIKGKVYQQRSIKADSSTTAFDYINEIQIFPNPSAGVFNILTQFTESYKINLFDITGRMLISVTNNENLYTLDLSTYSNGVYRIELLDITTNQRINKSILLNK